MKFIPPHIRYFFKDPDRKKICNILFEFIHTMLVKNEIPIHYFTRFLYRKNNSNYLNYLSNVEVDKIQSYFNDSNYIPLLENKLLFSLYFQSFNITIPKIKAYNINPLSQL